MEKSIELEELAKRAQQEAQDDALWTNPANGIINGISKNDNVNPGRAIWEMVQNARDLTTDKANISFELTDNELIFSHDGKPFNAKTIKALILQTSSKDAEDKTQTGQYGTGFLTTHLFGRRILLDGAFQTIQGRDYYYNFKGFLIDRSTDNKDELIEKLKQQCEEAESWSSKSNEWVPSPATQTVFHYLITNDFEKDNAKKAFELAPKLAPFVLAYNPRVRSISFKAEETNVTLISGEFKEDKNFDGYRLVTFEYQESQNGDSQIGKIIYMLESLDIDENSNEPTFSVILPLEKTNDKIRVIPYSSKMPNLYINLPLMGTEDFGCNFFIHSPLFTCSNDNRDSLRLAANGESYQNIAKQNCDILRSAFSAVTDFVSKNYSSWIDVKYIAKVDFQTSDEKVKPFYLELQKKLVDCYKQCNLICINQDDSQFIKPEDVKVLDSNIIGILPTDESNNEDLKAIYKIMCGLFSNGVVPSLKDLKYWSGTIQKWYPDGNDCFTSLEDLVNYVDKPESIIDINSLLTFDKLLKLNGLDKYFKTYKLLPNTEEKRFISTDLRQPAKFTNDFIGVLKVIVPQDVEKFVHPSFAEVDNYVEYNEDNAKENISTECTNNLLKPISDEARKWKDSGSSYTPNSGVLLSKEMLKALSEYVSMQLSNESEAFYKKALESVLEFNDITLENSFKLDKNKYELRGALRLLLTDTLFHFSILSIEAKIERKSWLKTLLQNIYGFSEFRSMLDNFKVYPTKANTFDWAENIFKAVNIPDEMLDVYNDVINIDKPQGEDKDNIRIKILDSDFDSCFDGKQSKNNILFGKEIMDTMIPANETEDAKITNILVGKYKNVVNAIIDKIRNEHQPDKTWHESFPKITALLPKIMLVLIPADVSSKLIRLASGKAKEHLDKIVELSEDPDFEKILELGKQALIKERNNDVDFDYKKRLGNHVESLLRKELEDKLSDIDKIEVKTLNVKDQQGGQDIIVSYDNKAIYYIEVKSRWTTADSVEMSKLQLNQSIKQKDNYALCAIDMTDYPRENALEHKYPDNIEETLSKMKVLTNIGYLNEKFISIVDGEYNTESVHIGGDYKDVIPQKIFNKSTTLNELINLIAEKIQEENNETIK